MNLQEAVESSQDILDTIREVKGEQYVRMLTFTINARSLGQMALEGFGREDIESSLRIAQMSFGIIQDFADALEFTMTPSVWTEILDTAVAIETRIRRAE